MSAARGASRTVITYKDRDQYTLVYLDGKRVGRILIFVGKGYAYIPAGGERGEFFPTLSLCKKSLEAS